MDKTFVLSGTALSCSLGSETAILKVSKYRKAKMHSKNLASIADNEGGVNIKSFQMCKRTLPDQMVPCTPKTCMKWLNGKKDFKIEGEQALLTTSTISCVHGGIIKIEKNNG